MEAEVAVMHTKDSVEGQCSVLKLEKARKQVFSWNFQAAGKPANNLILSS